MMGYYATVSCTLLVLLSGLQAVLASPMASSPQFHFTASSAPLAKRPLTGRFLHITDMHPDSHYLVNATVASSCHRHANDDYYNFKHDNNDGLRIAGYWGEGYSGCDSPVRLVNLTLNFLDQAWTKDIDFVVWTGDNARHDSDDDIPRTLEEIYQLNEWVASRMEEVFVSKGIPVVPSLGNNDIFPHNTLEPGPNEITHEYSSIWNTFIPREQHIDFQRGAYYAVEVIPDRVAVVSLNTIYFFESNKAVGGCRWNDQEEDPGNVEFDWLDQQLKAYRERGIKVWISGHVPPSAYNYYEQCYVRYAELSLRYQDTILGHLYGHMNTDHFSLVRAEDLELWSSSKKNGVEATKKSKSELFQELMESFATVPRKEEETEEGDYAIINVSPSVIPNPFLPSFRIFTYNVTRGGGDQEEEGTETKDAQQKRDRGQRPLEGMTATRARHHECRKATWKKTWACQLDEAWHSDFRAPSRMNRLWTPLGYAQYFIPAEELRTESEPAFELEYLTYAVDRLHPAEGETEEGFEYPVPLEHLPEVLRDVKGAQGVVKRYTPYGLADLTVGSWLGLARRLTSKGGAGVQEAFRRHMFMEN